MINALFFSIVLLAGLYFVALSVASLTSPARASSFLLGFAGSASAHYFELFIRLLVGYAFIVRASHMPFTSAFSLFGWLLVVTSAGLLLVPWQWHQRFAQKAVPQALRHLWLIAFGSLFLGGAVLWSAFRGAA